MRRRQTSWRPWIKSTLDSRICNPGEETRSQIYNTIEHMNTDQPQAPIHINYRWHPCGPPDLCLADLSMTRAEFATAVSDRRLAFFCESDQKMDQALTGIHWVIHRALQHLWVPILAAGTVLVIVHVWYWALLFVPLSILPARVLGRISNYLVYDSVLRCDAFYAKPEVQREVKILLASRSGKEEVNAKWKLQQEWNALSSRAERCAMSEKHGWGTVNLQTGIRTPWSEITRV